MEHNSIPTVFSISSVTACFVLSLLHTGSVLGDNEEFCDSDENDDAQGDNAETEPSFCQEVILNDNPSLYDQDDHNILSALATSNLDKTFPSHVDSSLAFAVFDEMPYPVPTGASPYFMVLLTVIFTWYFTKLIHWMLRDTAKTLDLFPVTDHFPKVYLYMLQQSRRESLLSRDARNTWSWLAKFYLLKPSDPLVNTEEIIRSRGQNNSEVPQDVWGVIDAILRVNAADKNSENYETGGIPGQTNATTADKNIPTYAEGTAGVANANLNTMDDDGRGQDNNRLLLLRKLLGQSESLPPSPPDDNPSPDDNPYPEEQIQTTLSMQSMNELNFYTEK